MSENEFKVLKQPANTMMRSYLTSIVDQQFATRDSLLSTLRSVHDWEARSQAIRDSIISWTGPLPDRSPLNARVTGRIEREDYIIEKILFESRPNYLVSATLYLPKGYSFPRPALLNHIGHAQVGKADERYQRLSISQARNGFVVLTMDCLGQGERQVSKYDSWGSAPGRDVILYLNENGKSAIFEDIKVLEELLDKRYILCPVDLRGFGETSPDMSARIWDFLAGKPVFGQRVVDVLSIIKWLKESELAAREIKLWGTGMCSLYGAFAGALSDDIAGFIFEKPLISFESVVNVKLPGYNHEILLPGILEKFDMPQVYQALAPRPVLILNPYLGDKTTAGKADIKEIDTPVSTTYRSLRRAGNWLVQSVDPFERENIIMSSLAGN